MSQNKIKLSVVASTQQRMVAVITTFFCLNIHMKTVEFKIGCGALDKILKCQIP